MEKIKGIPIMFLLVLVTLSACFEVVPTLQEGCDMPNAKDIEMTSGSTLVDMTVGVSTEQELKAKFGEPKLIGSWPIKQKPTIACRYLYEIEDLDNNQVIFWLAGSKVIGIELIEPPPQKIADLRTLYGTPELVGWSKRQGFTYRTVVWLNRGILVEVGLSPEIDNSTIFSILYFTPMSKTEFGNFVWSQLVLDIPPESNSDVMDGWPRDPFNW